MRLFFILAIFIFSSSACKIQKNFSDVNVVNGKTVKDAKSALGTYQIFGFDNKKKAAFSASVVAIHQGKNFNTFITNAHVIESIKQFASANIVDLNGGIVASFQMIDSQVKLYMDPGFKNKDRSLSDSMDIGAIIFSTPIDSRRFANGIARVAKIPLSQGGKITLVGGGYADYRVLQKPTEKMRKEFHNDFPDEKSFFEATMSGFLRWGENYIKNSYPPKGFYRGGYIIEGVARHTVDVTGKSVSAPGDSGGGVYNSSERLVGIMQGGGKVTMEGEDPANANAAYSFIVDILQQETFFKEIRNLGSFL